MTLCPRVQFFLANPVYHFGIRGIAHDWFKSYLVNHLLHVEFTKPCSQLGLEKLLVFALITITNTITT